MVTIFLGHILKWYWINHKRVLILPWIDFNILINVMKHIIFSTVYYLLVSNHVFECYIISEKPNNGKIFIKLFFFFLLVDRDKKITLKHPQKTLFCQNYNGIINNSYEPKTKLGCRFHSFERYKWINLSKFIIILQISKNFQ